MTVQTFASCILSKFYIKPQPERASNVSAQGCILSKFYIKPQPGAAVRHDGVVVSYRNSTSNHNEDIADARSRPVVSYRNSTSNHNISGALGQLFGLYLIEILHQTTTDCPPAILAPMLYLIEILHQTTTVGRILPPPSRLYLIEILHQTTTRRLAWSSRRELYLIEILHQTTTMPAASGNFNSCILSKFYIKPQLSLMVLLSRSVVSYRNSTSNHNYAKEYSLPSRLYLIEILHQTTTTRRFFDLAGRLYLIEILHQTTTSTL